MCFWMPDTSLSFLSFKETFKDWGFLFLCFCDILVEIQRVNSETHSTVPVVSDLDKLLSQCLSQYAIPLALKPSFSLPLALSLSLSFYLLTSPLLPACLPSLPSSLVSPLHPSLRHSQHVTSFISSIALSTCLPFFFLPKCYYLISLGVLRHTNSPKISFFVFTVTSLVLRRFLFFS